MQVPLIDLKAQYASIKSEIDAAIQKILETSEFVYGPTVQSFERGFSEIHNVRYTLACSSGTDALHLILWALGIGAGDEVIMPCYTFIATAEAPLLLDAKPVFVDIDEATFTMDPVAFAAAITSRTKAVIPVHLYGHPCTMEPILEQAQKHNLFVIEDACQAHLAEHTGRKVGSFGIASAFSFYPTKNLGAYGEGGAVVTSDEAVFRKVSQLRDHGQTERYRHDQWGHNYRMEGFQGAVLGVKMKYIQRWTEARRKNAHLYNQRLRGIPEIVTPSEESSAKHVYYLYVIRARQRDKLRDHLTAKGIGTGLHYPIPLHFQKAFSELGYGEGAFPVAERACKEVLSLPMYPELTEEQINFVCEAIQEFFKRGRRQ